MEESKQQKGTNTNAITCNTQTTLHSLNWSQRWQRTSSCKQQYKLWLKCCISGERKDSPQTQALPLLCGWSPQALHTGSRLCLGHLGSCSCILTQRGFVWRGLSSSLYGWYWCRKLQDDAKEQLLLRDCVSCHIHFCYMPYVDNFNSINVLRLSFRVRYSRLLCKIIKMSLIF